VETEKTKLRPSATAARVLLNTVEQRWRRQNAALGFLCGVAALLAFDELCPIPEGAGPLAGLTTALTLPQWPSASDRVDSAEPLRRRVDDALANAGLGNVAGNRCHERVIGIADATGIGYDCIAQFTICAHQSRADTLRCTGDDGDALSIGHSHFLRDVGDCLQ
jgi:hypothetical protein